jgi:hypothetical protein
VFEARGLRYVVLELFDIILLFCYTWWERRFFMPHEFYGDPIREAQELLDRGVCRTYDAGYATTNVNVEAIPWETLEHMGYTPYRVLKMIRGYLDLVEGRRPLVETNTRLTEENRELRRRLDAKG